MLSECEAEADKMPLSSMNVTLNNTWVVVSLFGYTQIVIESNEF